MISVKKNLIGHVLRMDDASLLYTSKLPTLSTVEVSLSRYDDKRRLLHMNSMCIVYLLSQMC